ncbi:MAG: hypothetical protein C0425_02615 [Chlorobiaceae bacterium]|nr:hypothetical protein [Chlorobiaceae bacterium]MBA4309214.1 hypothetical protein [Chlorobiaceae bacterium]
MTHQIKNLAPVKSNILFRDVKFDNLKINLSTKDALFFKEGDIIFKSQEKADVVFLIISGNVKIKFNTPIDGVRLFHKSGGTFFGEKEFLDNTSRVSSAVAETDCELYPLQRKELNNIISKERRILGNLQGDSFTTETEIRELEEMQSSEKKDEPILSDEEEATPIEKDYSTYNRVDQKSFSKTEEIILDDAELNFSFKNEAATTADQKIIDDDEALSWDKILNETPLETETSLPQEEENFSIEEDEKINLKDIFDEEPQNNFLTEENYYSIEKNDLKEKDVDVIEDSLLKNVDVLNDENLFKNISLESKESVPINGGAVLTTEHLRLINEAAQKVNSNIRIDETLNAIVEAATSLTNADRGTLYIVDREAGELWSKVLRGENIEEIRLKIGQGLAGYVAENGEVINILDAQTDPRFDSEVDKKTGYKTHSMLCYPIKNKEGEIIGVHQLLNSKNGFFSSIDEQFLEALSIHASLSLENANLVQQMLRSDKLLSLGKVANFILSDVKKPIMSIRQYIEHLKKKNVADDIRMILDLIIEQTNTVNDLIHTTLSYSEGKMLSKRRATSLNTALNDILEKLADYVDHRKVKLFKKLDKDVIVNLDKKEFYQACFQITKNACDAMPEGGNLYVTSKLEENLISISFKDTGIGIPSSVIENVFEPFFSHGKKQCVGLGLSIAEKIVKDQDGTVTADSDIGEGATFTIYLPIYKADG